MANIKKNTASFTVNVNLTATNGITGILGMSGSGKSLFFKCLAGIETPDEGEIILDGKVLFSSKDKINLPSRQRQIAYLFQNCGLFPNMTVEDNIKICSKEGDITPIVKLCRAENLLKSYPNKLSGGEKQRVAIARILVSAPKVILLDEPFSAMDTPLKEDIQGDMLKVLSSFNGIVFLVSHSASELYRFAEDVAVIHQGEILEQGNKNLVYNSPKYPISAKLLGYDNCVKLDEHIKNLLSINTTKEYLYFKGKNINLIHSDNSPIKVVDQLQEMEGYLIYLQLSENTTIKVKSLNPFSVGDRVSIGFNKPPLLL